MRYRPLGHTGVEVHCLGAMMFGSVGNPDHEDSARIKLGCEVFWIDLLYRLRGFWIDTGVSVMAKVTLQTIADAVGVSRSTVSNAYSRPDQLTADLRKKIMETAATLGYAGPDAAARTLRRGQANTVGVLFTAKLSYAFADPYSVGFLGGLAEVAEQYGTSLLLLPLREDDEAAAVQSVRDAVVDGFCVYC